MPVSEVHNMDCMEGMKKFPDKFFDLAIVDPPFGIGKNWNKAKDHRNYRLKSSYRNDKPPDKKYLKELMRVSNYQIIWGCNYFWNLLPPTNNLIFWDKGIDPELHLRSAGNLAWTNIKKYPFNRIFLRWAGAITCEPRSGIHPHEAPIKLYSWLLRKYAKKGWKILDTHLGSGSSRIAAFKLGFDFYGFELDEKHFNDQEERFKREIRQPLFDNLSSIA